MVDNEIDIMIVGKNNFSLSYDENSELVCTRGGNQANCRWKLKLEPNKEVEDIMIDSRLKLNDAFSSKLKFAQQPIENINLNNNNNQLQLVPLSDVELTVNTAAPIIAPATCTPLNVNNSDSNSNIIASSQGVKTSGVECGVNSSVVYVQGFGNGVRTHYTIAVISHIQSNL